MKNEIKMFFVIFLTSLTFTKTWASCRKYDVRRGYNNYYSRNNHLYSYAVCGNITLQTGKQLAIPNSNRDDFKYITFENSTITVIPVGVFTAFTTVKEIYLNSSKVSTIEPGAFNGMSKLESLYLGDNNIQEIMRGTLNSLTNLKVLDLSRNHLFKIEDNALHGLLKLETLILANNNINNVTSRTFSSLSALKSLDLCHNPLRQIDENAFLNATALRVLNVSFNELEKIDFNFLPQSLMVLNISNNKLNDAQNWSKLPNVQTVDLRNNNLTEMVALDGNIVNLYLGFNNLNFFNSSVFNRSEKLKELDLSHNSIWKIELDLFQSLSKLVNLTLNNNQLKHIPLGTFKNLTSLKVLDLSYNFLTDLEFGTFAGLSQLEKLYLDHNKLMGIHENSFHILGKLTTLSLNDNSINSMDAVNLLTQLNSLKIIAVHNNNWTCNALLSALKAFQNRKVSFGRGSSYDVPNIDGMPCTNDKALVNNEIASVEITTIANANEIVAEPPKENLIDNFHNTSFYKYFNHDFFNSSFFKYFNEDFKFSEFFKYQQRNLSPLNFNVCCENFTKFNSQPLELLAGNESDGKFEVFAVIFMVIITVLLVVIIIFLLALYRSVHKYKILRTEENECILGTELELI